MIKLPYQVKIKSITDAAVGIFLIVVAAIFGKLCADLVDSPLIGIVGGGLFLYAALICFELVVSDGE